MSIKIIRHLEESNAVKDQFEQIEHIASESGRQIMQEIELKTQFSNLSSKI